jgi:hypothetical protein
MLLRWAKQVKRMVKEYLERVNPRYSPLGLHLRLEKRFLRRWVLVITVQTHDRTLPDLIIITLVACVRPQRELSLSLYVMHTISPPTTGGAAARPVLAALRWLKPSKRTAAPAAAARGLQSGVHPH